MNNILVAHRERAGFHHKQTRWKDYIFHFVDFSFHDTFKIKDSGEIQGVLSSDKMQNAVRAVSTGSYDAVYCGSAEAFLLQFVLERKRLPVPPFVIMDLNRLVKARALCRWIESAYGENPFNRVLSRPENFWFCYTNSELSEHEAMGIERERLFYVPCSLYFQDETMTEEKGRAKQFFRSPEPETQNPFLEAVRGKVIAGGNNNRDYETLLLAADGLPFEVHIFSSDFYAKKPNSVPANVHVHDYVPLESLYEILRAAQFVVLPLKPTFLSPGTATAALSIGFGKPVVASDFPCLHDYVRNGENGILVKHGDARSLRKAILELYENKTLQHQMSLNSKNISDSLDAIAEKTLEAVFARAAECASCSRETVLRM